MEPKKLKQIIEAALMASGGALKLENIESLFEGDDDFPSRDEVLKALHELMQECVDRGVELKEISSGFRYQARQEMSQWVQRLWEEKPQRYSRALLETLALVAYRQPITRSEIEEVRGVSVSSTIMKTLQEREWVRVVGHRDVPGKPAMYATTRGFLDYFSLQSLDELPTLSEIRDIDNINVELVFEDKDAEQGEAAVESAEVAVVEAVESDEKPAAEEQQQEVQEGGVDAVSAEIPEEEELMKGLSDEEMKAIDVLNKSFRDNLHGPASVEESEEESTDEESTSSGSELATETDKDESATIEADDDIEDLSSDTEEDQEPEQETKL